MPVMSGFEALNKIKKFKPQLILVAQSAYSTAEEIEKALSIGFDDFISKPISVQNFQNLINKHLYNFTEENLQD
mgnify:FL=1